MALFEIGKIVRSHGLTGRMKVYSYLESQEALEHLPEVHVGSTMEKSTSFAVDAVQPGTDFFLLKLRGVDDREAAEKFRGSFVWMTADRRKPLAEGEYYWGEIVGLKVVTEDGQCLGRIESVFPTGSNDVYVCRSGQREILLPATEEVVRKIDTDQGVMVVKLLEGLMEP